jgi:hypothetical protein
MRICIRLGDREICFWIPIILYPIHPPKPDPEFKDYAELITDATILASVRAVANQLSDAKVREALHGGLNKALEAAQDRAGAHVSLSFER